MCRQERGRKSRQPARAAGSVKHQGRGVAMALKEWMELYEQEPNVATAQLYEFVIRVRILVAASAPSSRARSAP